MEYWDFPRVKVMTVGTGENIAGKITSRGLRKLRLSAGRSLGPVGSSDLSERAYILK
jgi:hypothetical protein